MLGRVRLISRNDKASLVAGGLGVFQDGQRAATHVASDA
nr:putative integron gene cassette protein [uncultured bacterium]